MEPAPVTGYGRRVELPDFHIDHAEKIEWMIETEGFAVEPVPADLASDPPRAGYTYTIGLTAHVGFPEVVVFGLKPAQARNLLVLVRDLCRSGVEIPLDVEVIGVLDHDLRCRFAHVDVEEWAPLFTTGVAWPRGEPFELVQLVYPDPNGFLPYEAGFDQRRVYSQPVIGVVD